MLRIFIIIFLIQAICHWCCATSDARDAKRGWISSCVKVGGFHSETWMLNPTQQQFPQQNGWRNTDTKSADVGSLLWKSSFFTSFWKEDFMVSCVFHRMFSQHPAQRGSGPCWGALRKNTFIKYVTCLACKQWILRPAHSAGSDDSRIFFLSYYLYLVK